MITVNNETKIDNIMATAEVEIYDVVYDERFGYNSNDGKFFKNSLDLSGIFIIGGPLNYNPNKYKYYIGIAQKNVTGITRDINWKYHLKGGDYEIELPEQGLFIPFSVIAINGTTQPYQIYFYRDDGYSSLGNDYNYVFDAEFRAAHKGEILFLTIG